MLIFENKFNFIKYNSIFQIMYNNQINNNQINNNQINNILNDNHSKIFFLKAILLGINYGNDNNSELYKTTIEKELSDLTKENIINEQSIIKQDIIKQDIIKQDNITQSNLLIQYRNKLLHLNNEKKYIILYISNLSKNYLVNQTKINLLKNSLLLLNRNINKITEFIQKNNDLSKFNLNNINLNNINNEIDKIKLDNELEETLGKLSNLIVN